MKNLVLVVAIIFCFCGYGSAQRLNLELTSPNGWKIWLDKDAQWEKDKLFLPGEFILSDLPVNIPTCGWTNLYETVGKSCGVPTSVEKEFGEGHDWSYHGVSWLCRDFEVSSEWINKRVFLTIEQYNHRVEVFVNERLVGYDVVGLLPYKCDITDALKPGHKNNLAIRVTSPGGNRGWMDMYPVKWGNQTLISEKDFSGIGGKIVLTAVDKSFISDVFVKNLRPAKSNKIEVETTVNHMDDQDVDGTYCIEICDKKNNKTLLNQKFSCVLQKGTNKLNRVFVLPEARQWDENNPELYTCRVTLSTQRSFDKYDQTFGFRVFELKSVNGRNHFYLNGKRIRFRSAIDWGIYAYNGLFPTSKAAERSIKAVKEVGHNSLNFHRKLGYTSLFENADSLGVYIYEEPGGFHNGGKVADSLSFMHKQMYERLRRMVIRDRNHPSLLIYCLSNEDNVWSHDREMGMRIIHGNDSTRLIINSSGGNGGGFSVGGVAHIRPYEQEIRMDYNDNHTVSSTVGSAVSLNKEDFNRCVSNVFDEKGRLLDHVTNDSLSVTYWGEVRCYAGTFNYPLLYSQGKEEGGGYDLSMYASQANKVNELFKTCRLKNMGRGTIQTVYDLTRQAGAGQYYSDGRLGQIIMANDYSDGYAINGWTPGPDMPAEWFSAILDQNRNLNAPGEKMSYWNKPLQIAIMRLNGKYFIPGDTVKVNLFLVNEGKIEAGNYRLSLRIKDGTGKYVGKKDELPVWVKGGDVFAQTIHEEYSFVLSPDWGSGYITLEGTLLQGKKVVTSGSEQVLLQNRPSQFRHLKGSKIAVLNWPAAEVALRDAKIAPTTLLKKASLILMGKDSREEDWDMALAAVDKGANLVLQLDSSSNDMLIKKGLLNEPITAWGGLQTAHWAGNGSSYIDVFAGNQPLPSSGTISTRSWEASGNPVGFYPFRSNYKQRAYGLYFAHQYK